MIKCFSFILEFVLLIVFAISSQGFVASSKSGIPDLDVRQRLLQETIANDKSAGVNRLRSLVPNARISFDPVICSPRSIYVVGMCLTGTNDGKGAVSPAAFAKISVTDAYRPVKAFLEEHKLLFGYGAEILASSRVTRDYVTPHNGLRTVVWEQQVDGIPVFEGVLAAHTTKKGELAVVSSHFLADPKAAAAIGTPHASALIASSGITAREALIFAATEVGDENMEPRAYTTGITNSQDYHQVFLSPLLKGFAHVQLVWLPMGKDALRLCWKTLFFSRARGEMFLTLVDVENGDVLVRRNLTRHISSASYRVFTKDSPTPMFPGLSDSSTAQPSVVSRDLVVIDAFDTNASPNGWMADADNQTVGNNVDAHLDWNGDNVADLPRPTGTPNRIFDFPIDLNADPRSNANASVTQLFYLCNWYHDKLYELGFTEAAGNFQTDNFGRGGMGNDAVLADDQDGSDTDNASFSTPSDGYSPRMQMYLFTDPQPARDGALDATVVLHEYTHGLSERLVGGGVGIYTSQASGMGEGWSDFYALCQICDVDGDLNACYPMAAYAAYGKSGLYRNYYFGMRRYPYSTDMTKNPLTFKDIDPGQISLHTGVPLSPIFPFNAVNANEVHYQGEVWCSMLWDVRAAMIRKYGGLAGNHLVLQLVTDGMRLSPANPNFIEARDAILNADSIDNNGADLKEISAAFARRGLGLSASSPDSWTTIGVVESFDAMDDLRIGDKNCVSSGSTGGPFVYTYYTWSLDNYDMTPLVWKAAPEASWMSLTSSNGVLLNGTSASLTAFLNSNAYALPAGKYTNRIWVTNLISGQVQRRLFVLNIDQPDYFVQEVENSHILEGRSFTFTPDYSSSGYSVCYDTITDYPTSIEGDLNLNFCDDTNLYVSLSGSNRVSFYGQKFPGFFIGSNGYITFESGDSKNEETLYHFFQLPRISGFLTDLNPSVGGSVSWKELEDRIIVTWNDVSQYGVENTNDFQIEMFFDGRIRLNYLQMDSTHGIVGLSQGNGVPANFFASDFSSYRRCGTAMPSLRITAPSSVEKGVTNATATLNVSEILGTNAFISITSSDPSLVEVPDVTIIEAGQTNVTVPLTIAVANDVLNGPQTVKITASAFGMFSNVTFITVVDSVVPSLALSLPTSAMQGTTIQGSIQLENAAQYDLPIFLSLSNTQWVRTPSVVVMRAGETNAVFNATFETNSSSISKLVSFTASANGWSEASASVFIRNCPEKPGILDHFEWGTVASTQRRNTPFKSCLRMFDNLNQPVTNSVSLTFSAIVSNASNTLLNSMSPLNTSSFGTFTLGYSFTPTTNITVTHVRSYGGSKISIWGEDQTLLASVPVDNVTGQWINTPLTNAIELSAGSHYYLGVYTGGNIYAWSSATFPKTFAHGTINLGGYASTDAFPTRTSSRFYLVDLCYIVSSCRAISISPGSFQGEINGTWTGEFLLDGIAKGVMLTVDDGAGHLAASAPFDLLDATLPKIEAHFVGGNIVLAWTVDASDYVLENTASLSSPLWSIVTNAPISDGLYHYLTNRPSDKAQFYRLRK